MDYNIVRQIGEGAFSEVFLVEKDGKQYILKRFRSKDIKEAEREFLFLKMINSAHVPDAVEIIKDEYPGIIQEYIEGSSIEDYLKENPDKKAMLQVRLCEVLSEIHSFGICLNDIKPDNIIIRNDIPVFIDFGLATLNNFWDKRIRGSISYSSPEKLKKQINTQASDVFSLGLVLYYTDTLKHFADNFEPAEYQNILADNTRWNGARNRFISNPVITELTDYTPDNRPSAISLFLSMAEKAGYDIGESSFNLLKSYVFTCHQKALAILKRNRKLTVTAEDEPDIITSLFITKEISENNKVAVIDEELFTYNTELFMSRLRERPGLEDIDEQSLIDSLVSSEYKLILITKNEISDYFMPLFKSENTVTLIISDSISEASFVEPAELKNIFARLKSEVDLKELINIKPLSAKKILCPAKSVSEELTEYVESFLRISKFLDLSIPLQFFQKLWDNWIVLLKFMMDNSTISIADNSLKPIITIADATGLSEDDMDRLSTAFSDWNADLLKSIYFLKLGNMDMAKETTFEHFKVLLNRKMYHSIYYSYKKIKDISNEAFDDYRLGKLCATTVGKAGYKKEALEIYNNLSQKLDGDEKGTVALDKAIILQDLQLWNEAEKEYGIATEIFQKTGNVKLQIRISNNLGAFYTNNKNYKKAQYHLYKVIELCDLLNDHKRQIIYKMVAYYNLSEISLSSGLWSKCIQLAKKSLKIAIQERNKTIQNYCESILLTAMISNGQLTDIQVMVNELIEAEFNEQDRDAADFMLSKILLWQSFRDPLTYKDIAEKNIERINTTASSELLIEFYFYSLRALNIANVNRIRFLLHDDHYNEIITGIENKNDDKILTSLRHFAANDDIFQFLHISYHMKMLGLIDKGSKLDNYITEFSGYNNFYPLQQIKKHEVSKSHDNDVFWDAFSSIQTQNDFESIAMETLKSILNVGNLERAIFFAYKKGEFVTELCINDQMDILPKENMKVSKTILMETVQEKKMMYYFNLQEDTPFDLHSSIFGLGLRTAICYPVIINKVTKGVIYSDAQADKTFSDEDKKMLETFLMLCESIMEKNQLLDDINNPVLSSANFSTANQYNEIIGTSRKMQKVFSLMNVVAKHNVNVLITGETGSGKELIARALHKDYTKSAPFVAVNCAAIPENLLESELFGYVKGAFTGAVQNKMGKLELANNGTLFLDEIGDMPFQLQAKLLRVIQEREFTPVGDVKPKPVSVRIISATNRKLEEMVSSNEFRQDLLFRLKVFEIEIPPLRERKDDIPLLIHHFIKLNNDKFGKSIKGISTDAVSMLQNREWEGNVRELQNEIEKASILCQADVISEEQFLDMKKNNNFNIVDEMPEKWSDFLNYKKKITHRLDKIYIEKLLKTTDGNISQAGKLSGMPRNQIYRIMKHS